MNAKTKILSDSSRKKSKLPANRRKNASRPKNTKRQISESDGGKRRQQRRKTIRTVLRVFATLAITGATIWAGLATYTHTTTSPYFAVSTVELSGASRLRKKEIFVTAGFVEGINIFRFDEERAKRSLEDHPWIETATVKRKLPRTLKIEISERKSVAVLIMDVPYLVDETGEVFKRWSEGDPIPAPVISGIRREEFIEDSVRVQERVRDAIHLAKRYRELGLERKAPLAEIHCEVEGGFSFATKQDPFYVRFGTGPYREKLSRLKLLLSRLSRDGKRPAMIYFDNEVRPDRVTVKVKPASSWASDRVKKSMKPSAKEKSVSKI